MGTKKRESYNFSEDIILKLIDPVFTKGMKNRDVVKSMVLNIFSSSNMEMLIDILHRKTVYNELYQGCYVAVVPPKYWKGEKYEEDILKDHGLLHEDGRLYGQVVADSGWDKEKFNPYHYQFKVDFFLMEETEKDGWQITVKQEEINAPELELLKDKEVIKHFKVKSSK